MQADSFMDEVGSELQLPGTSERLPVASATSEYHPWLPMLFDPSAQAPPIPGLPPWMAPGGSADAGPEPHHHWGINE